MRFKRRFDLDHPIVWHASRSPPASPIIQRSFREDPFSAAEWIEATWSFETLVTFLWYDVVTGGGSRTVGRHGPLPRVTTLSLPAASFLLRLWVQKGAEPQSKFVAIITCAARARGFSLYSGKGFGKTMNTVYAIIYTVAAAVAVTGVFFVVTALSS
jgi:hypothetical protein